MKRLKTACIAATLFLTIGQIGSHSSHGKLQSYPDLPDSPIGVGVSLGEPTGLTGKYWFHPEHAIEASLGWGFLREGSVWLSASYQIHRFDLIASDTQNFPVYFGGGVRFKFEDEFRFGLKVPVGIEFPLYDPPITFFAEVAPILDLAPSFAPSIGVAIGGRYFF